MGKTLNGKIVLFDYSYSKIFLLAGIICFILLLYSLSTMMIMLLIGTPPSTIQECFDILNTNKLFGLLRLDILTVFTMPLYFILFYAIYRALLSKDNELLNLSTISVFSGLILFLATPSVFSYLNLSDNFAIANNEITKQQLLSAGQAIFSSDMWHGTGAKIGGLLIQIGATCVSILMLKRKIINRPTAIVGIITHGLDLLHILIGFILPSVGAIFLAVGGTLYLLWFPMLGMQFFKLRKYCIDKKD